MANQRSILIQAAIKAVRVYGMDGVRMQHIGQIAHATPSSIYQYFKGKDELLRVCFEQIDHEIAYIFDKISTMEEEMAVDPRQTLRTVWSAFWRWLADHPDETIFYHNYRDWSGFAEYDMNRDVSHFEPFVRQLRILRQRYPGLCAVPRVILWLYVLEGTVMYAKYVAQGLIQDTPETEDAVFRLLMGGVEGLMKA